MSSSPPSSTWSKRPLVPEDQPRLPLVSFCLSVRPGWRILRLQATKRQETLVNGAVSPIFRVPLNSEKKKPTFISMEMLK